MDLAGLFVATSFLGYASGAAGQELGRPVVAVLAYNYAKVPTAEMAAATALVTMMYGQAHIDIHWFNPLEDHSYVVSPTSNGFGAFTVEMLIRSHGPLEWSRNPDWIVGRAFPASASGGVLWLLYDQIRRSARVYHRPIADVLALAMAHELGHLLLPYPAHAPKGIMSGSWTGNDLRSDTYLPQPFTAAQASAMQAKILACCSAMRAARGPDR